MALVRNLFATAKAADRGRKQDKLLGEFAAQKRGRLRAESCRVALEQGPRIYNNEVKPSSPKRVTFSQLSYASRYFYPRLRSVVSSRPSVRTVANENIVYKLAGTGYQRSYAERCFACVKNGNVFVSTVY